MVALMPDGPRPPNPFDPTRAAYKDWLHVNFFDHESGCVGLINASLHGDPADPRATAVGAALLHVPQSGWFGNVEVFRAAGARVGLSSIALPNAAIAIDSALGRVVVAAKIGALEIELEATATSFGYELPGAVAFGSGWMSWAVVPRLTIRGTVRLDGRVFRLDGASAYQDHNWGRWHWGDGGRWEWGAFLAPDAGPAFVLARPTNRARTAIAPPTLMVVHGSRRRTFAGASVEVRYEGVLDVRLRRLPGVLAAMHQDRARPRLPERVHVRCRDGIDEVTIAFIATDAAQLIAGDPAVPGYAFIHELAGTFEASGRVGGTDVRTSGLGVFEYLL